MKYKYKDNPSLLTLLLMSADSVRVRIGCTLSDNDLIISDLLVGDASSTEGSLDFLQAFVLTFLFFVLLFNRVGIGIKDEDWREIFFLIFC